MRVNAGGVRGRGRRRTPEHVVAHSARAPLQGSRLGRRRQPSASRGRGLIERLTNGVAIRFFTRMCADSAAGGGVCGGGGVCVRARASAYVCLCVCICLFGVPVRARARAR